MYNKEKAILSYFNQYEKICCCLKLKWIKAIEILYNSGYWKSCVDSAKSSSTISLPHG